MNFDFHTHAKLSKKVDFSLPYFETMAKKAIECGLDGIALTEHFNTKNFREVYDTLDAHFPYENGYYNIHGLKVFPGMEVDILEVGHILCIGDLQDVRAMREQLNDYTKKGGFVPFAQLLEMRSQYEMLVIGAHPYRPSTPLKDLDPSLLRQLDAFDLNGKDLHTRGIEENTADVKSLGSALDKPVVGGSDTHHFMQYGAVYTILDETCNHVSELKEIVVNRRFSINVADDLHERVMEAIRLKEIEKRKVLEIVE
ncbi:PHP domain-containing protein [Ureibacillus sinduriensis]|uniref:Histidinol phosphatase n=1 Tax=Ureibacillus sinduriensis BLB-1 = JCM 15800 TaxID=1384057 RepID=A0A0A3HZY3_9BACL|nr:PHP domain-containing protein [Ureibacillus sinduriensis]KGR75943.1 histidinol phosphatase [Ureibacillus sinduriensis BLB-1 = JCM 15800]